MRTLVLLSLVAVTACAPAAMGPAPVRTPNSSIVIDASGRGANFGSGSEVFAAPQRIGAPFERTWRAVLATYAATELPAERVHPAAGQIVSRFTVNGRIMGVPASTFLACGSTMGVSELANAYMVEVLLQVHVVPDGDTTRMDVQLSGIARDRFTNTQPRTCLTKGVLESRMAARVRERLELPDPAGGPPLGSVAARPGRLSDPPPGAPTSELVPPAAEELAVGPAHPLLLAAGAAAGGMAGTLLGLQLGEECEKRCFSARGTLGPLLGNAVLIPLGAHASNRGRGQLVNSVLVSAGWAAAAAVVGGFTGEDWPVWAVAPGQALTSVLLERSSTHR